MPYQISGSVNFTGGASNFINFQLTNIFQFVTTTPYDLIRGSAANGSVLERFTSVGAGNGNVLTIVNSANGQYNWTTPVTPTTNTGVFLTKNVNLAVASGTALNLNDWVVTAANGDYNNLSAFTIGTGVLNNQTANAKYDVWVQAEWGNNDNSGQRVLEIVLNGPTTSNVATVIARRTAQATPDITVNAVDMGTVATPLMVVNDLLWARVNQNSGVSIDVVPGVATRLRIIRIA